MLTASLDFVLLFLSVAVLASAALASKGAKEESSDEPSE
jgi:hypothetical protein